MLPVMFGSLQVATMSAGAPAGAHIVLPISFAPIAAVVVSLLLVPAMRAIIAKISSSLRASRLDLVGAPAGTQLSK